jgi:hypothetical protein
LVTLQLLAKDRDTVLIDAVNLEDVLGEIQTNCRDLHELLHVQAGNVARSHSGSRRTREKGGVHSSKTAADMLRIT